MILGAMIVPAGLFWYGWTAEKQYHWILPIMGTSVLDIGMVMVIVSGIHPTTSRSGLTFIC